jgi:hypothetical protein
LRRGRTQCRAQERESKTAARCCATSATCC